MKNTKGQPLLIFIIVLTLCMLFVACQRALVVNPTTTESKIWQVTETDVEQTEFALPIQTSTLAISPVPTATIASTVINITPAIVYKFLYVDFLGKNCDTTDTTEPYSLPGQKILEPDLNAEVLKAVLYLPIDVITPPTGINVIDPGVYGSSHYWKGLCWFISIPKRNMDGGYTFWYGGRDVIYWTDYVAGGQLYGNNGRWSWLENLTATSEVKPQSSLPDLTPTAPSPSIPTSTP